MKLKHPFPSFRLFLVGLCFLAVVACSDVAKTMRKLTYPPDFKYVTEEELQSNMQRMAYQMQLLEETLTDIDEDSTNQQQQVLNILASIERISSNLTADKGQSNHPFLEDHMVDFANQVARARLAASLNPPRYYQAGKIAGGCTNCHKVNR